MCRFLNGLKNYRRTKGAVLPILSGHAPAGFGRGRENLARNSDGLRYSSTGNDSCNMPQIQISMIVVLV